MSEPGSAKKNRDRVLLALCSRGVHTQTRLSVRLGIPIGTVSRALKQLVEDKSAVCVGLVHDPEVSAKRVNAYQITESGRLIAESMEAEQ